MQTRTRKKGPKGKGSGAAAIASASASGSRKADPPQFVDMGTSNCNFNFSPAEFLRCIQDAAVSVSAVTSEDSVRLTTWVSALSHSLHSTNTNNNKKKRPCASDSHTHNASHTHSSGTATATATFKEDETPEPPPSASSSAKRHRKKSKYLSPPYTHTHTDIIQYHSPQKQKLDFHTFSVPHLFNDLLFTAIDPLYLQCTTSAKLLHFFLHKFRNTMFLQGTQYAAFANHTSGCEMKGHPIHLDNGLLSLSLQSYLSPKMARPDLTTVHGVSRAKEQLERVTRKDNTHDGANQPNKQARPRKKEKSLSSSGPIMPMVEKNEIKDFAGSVSSVTYQTNINVGSETVLNFANETYQTNINVGSETVLNFANESCDFLKEARAQMMETTSMQKGNKLAGTGKQFQEQSGSSNKCNTGNGDTTCDTGPKQKGQKKKISKAHYQNPAALLFDFSKPNTTNGAAIGTGMDLPSRDQLLSTFSKFGLLVEAQSLVYPDAHTARVVFARSADAEVACNSPDKLGPFGAPYASCRLRYLPPISDLTTAAQPVQAPQIPAQQLSAKPQLSDIRKNLEIMISSLTGGSGLLVKQEPGSALDGIRPEVRGLLGEMQGLLMKVDKRLGNDGASSCAPQP